MVAFVCFCLRRRVAVMVHSVEGSPLQPWPLQKLDALGSVFRIVPKRPAIYLLPAGDQDGPNQPKCECNCAGSRMIASRGNEEMVSEILTWFPFWGDAFEWGLLTPTVWTSNGYNLFLHSLHSFWLDPQDPQTWLQVRGQHQPRNSWPSGSLQHMGPRQHSSNPKATNCKEVGQSKLENNEGIWIWKGVFRVCQVWSGSFKLSKCTNMYKAEHVWSMANPF